MADERTDAQAWADAEPLCSVEHGLRRIRIVSGQTHFSPRERLERVLEMAQRSVELLPAEEKRLAKERKEIERRDRALKDRERVILEIAERLRAGQGLDQLRDLRGVARGGPGKRRHRWRGGCAGGVAAHDV